MARGGFRFAAGKPEGRRRAPTFYRWFRIELHTAKWTAPFFCGTGHPRVAYLSIGKRRGLARGPGKSEQMKILFIGDIVGSPGREIVADRLADTVQSLQIDLVIANGENSAAGFGITPRIAEELFAAGVEVLTGGNHVWDRKEILEYIPQHPRLLRPANFPEGNPGSGLYIGTARNGVPYAVLDLQGRVFMAANDCPFRAADRELARIPADVRVIFVDIHAETTSEKEAMGWYLDGRVSAVIGTHTHVATADEQVLPGGTAFLTDVGMTGPHNGVIGMDKAAILRRFLYGQQSRFEVATGDIQMNTVWIDVDETTGRARGIESLRFRTG